MEITFHYNSYNDHMQPTGIVRNDAGTTGLAVADGQDFSLVGAPLVYERYGCRVTD